MANARHRKYASVNQVLRRAHVASVNITATEAVMAETASAPINVPAVLDILK